MRRTLLSSRLQQAKALLLIFESGEVTGQVLSTTVVARALQPQIFVGALSSDETLRDWLVYAGASSVTLTEQLIADTIIGCFYHTLGSQTRKATSTASEGVDTLQEHVISSASTRSASVSPRHCRTTATSSSSLMRMPPRCSGHHRGVSGGAGQADRARPFRRRTSLRPGRYSSRSEAAKK